MEERSRHIDIAKGVGILLVVFGHSWLVLIKEKELFNIVFSFHMPLFFFLSGVVFNPQERLRSIFLKKMDSLVKPYFVTLCAAFWFYDDLIVGDFRSYLVGVLYGSGSTIVWFHLWFLPHLFLVFLFSWCLIRGFERYAISLRNRYLLVILLYAVSAQYIDLAFPFELSWFGSVYRLGGLPFSADIIFLTAAFFTLGHLLRHQVLDFKPSALFGVLSMAAFVGCHYLFDRTLDLNLRRYDDLLVTTIQVFSGLYLVLYAAFWLRRLEIIGTALSVLGAASLFILIFHQKLQKFAFDSMVTDYENVSYAVVFAAFLVGCAVPVGIWLVVKRYDFLALFYLPLKSNRLFQRTLAKLG